MYFIVYEQVSFGDQNYKNFHNQKYDSVKKGKKKEKKT